MNLLDWDYDEKKYVITVETTHKELFYIALGFECAMSSLHDRIKSCCRVAVMRHGNF